MTPAARSAAVARVAAGETAHAVAASVGVSIHTVLRAARAARVRVRPPGRSRNPLVAPALTLARVEGITLREAAARVGVAVAVGAVYRANVLRARGAP